VLALSQDSAEAIIGMIAIVIGFIVCGVLWWLMVLKPSRAERRAKTPPKP
jgi:uncharacterized membrane protein YciS (DUF1049 family)